MIKHLSSERLRELRKSNNLGLTLLLLAFMVICSLANPNFLSSDNLVNVLRQQSVIVIVAFGEMLLIIGGMLDLSAGAVIALAGVISVNAFKATGSLVIAFLVAIGIAVFCNVLNGLMVTYGKVAAFIATLAMQTAARGMALWYTSGQNIYDLGRYTMVGQGKLLGIPNPVLIMIVLFGVMWYIMRNTRFGRSVYAIGGNEETANASGIHVPRTKMSAYILHGILVGIAAVIFMSRVNGGLPNGAQGYETDALTATIIGGTSFTGGVGTVTGTLLGAFIVGFLNNIMNLISIDSYIQQIVRGGIIAIAVLWDVYSKKKHTYSKGK